MGPFVLLAWVWSRLPTVTQKITALYERVLAWDTRFVAAVVIAIIEVLLIAFPWLRHR